MKACLTFFAAVALAIVTLGPVAEAQNGKLAPYANASIGFTGSGATLGQSNPDYRVGVGIESSSRHWLLDGNGQFDSANASLFGSGGTGYQTSAQVSVYRRLHGFLFGGGGFYSNRIAHATNGGGGTVSFNELTIQPFVGGGYQFSFDRLLANYYLPGRESNAETLVTNNAIGAHNRTAVISNEVFLGHSGITHHLRLTQAVRISSSNSNLFITRNFRTGSASASAGVKVVF